MAKSKTVHGKGSNLFCCNLGNLIAKSREHHFVLWSTTTKHHKLLVTRERKRYFDRRERNELRESVLLFLHHQMMQRVLLKSRWKEKIVRWIKDSIFCNERRPNVLSMAHYTMKVNEDLLCPTVIECTNIHFVIFFFRFLLLLPQRLLPPRCLKLTYVFLFCLRHVPATSSLGLSVVWRLDEIVCPRLFNRK